MKDKNQTMDQQVLEIRSRIGNSIREHRERKGYSQEQLAILMNISRSTISKIENGNFNISIDYISKFSKHLGFSEEKITLNFFLNP